MKTSDTVLRKIYLSLYLKGFEMVTQGFTVRGSWRPNRTATCWLPLLWPSALCLSCSSGLLNWRLGGPALYWVLAFSTASCHQNSPISKLIWLPVFTELYNSSMPTFLWASQIALIQPIHGQGYNILIDRMHLLFTKVHFLFWQPGLVVGQYTTIGEKLSH